MAKPLGYLVMEACEDYEQALCLLESQEGPPGGWLDWAGNAGPRAIFPSRAAARAAIDRTEHYRLAFGFKNGDALPEKKFCRIVPAVLVSA